MTPKYKVLSRPTGRAVIAVLAGVVLFFVTGWAAGERKLVVDWQAFQQGDALVFLGAYAQLVLAAAVFFQIRTADRALVRQVEGHEHALRSEQADALVTLVATAANARSLYVHAIPTLRNLAYNHGSRMLLIERKQNSSVPSTSAKMLTLPGSASKCCLRETRT